MWGWDGEIDIQGWVLKVADSPEPPPTDTEQNWEYSASQPSQNWEEKISDFLLRFQWFNFQLRWKGTHRKCFVNLKVVNLWLLNASIGNSFRDCKCGWCCKELWRLSWRLSERLKLWSAIKLQIRISKYLRSHWEIIGNTISSIINPPMEEFEY